MQSWLMCPIFSHKEMKNIYKSKKFKEFIGSDDLIKGAVEQRSSI
jgi:hypothetical protein